MSAHFTLRDYTDSSAADFPLTGSFVASSSFTTQGLPNLAINIVYDPDEADGTLDVEVQASDDPATTTDANSEWITIGVAARSTAIVTYAADTLRLASTAAGTKKYLQFTYTDVPYQKVRIRAKETFSSGGSNFGNARITGYAYSN